MQCISIISNLCDLPVIHGGAVSRTEPGTDVVGGLGPQAQQVQRVPSLHFLAAAGP